MCLQNRINISRLLPTASVQTRLFLTVPDFSYKIQIIHVSSVHIGLYATGIKALAIAAHFRVHVRILLMKACVVFVNSG